MLNSKDFLILIIQKNWQTTMLPSTSCLFHQREALIFSLKKNKNKQQPIVENSLEIFQ